MYANKSVSSCSVVLDPRLNGSCTEIMTIATNFVIKINRLKRSTSVVLLILNGIAVDNIQHEESIKICRKKIKHRT